MTRACIMFGALAVLAGCPLVAKALTPAQNCEASKLAAAGKYYFCRQKADMTAVKLDDAPDYGKCTAKFGQRWDIAETNAAGACPDNVAGSGSMEAYLASQAAEASGIIAGTENRPTCGDNAINVAGEQCDGADLGGASCATLGFASGSLSCSSCLFDTSGCGVWFPASGQITAFGTGSDGDVQAGKPLSYRDNGDGTITDTNTGLMWEKKSYDGSIHDVRNTYTWSMTVSPYTMNGTIVTEFLAGLNGGGGFAGHTDWRIPNVKELPSIVNYEVPGQGVYISPAFNMDCLAGCSVITCSCPGGSWSSTTYASYPSYAWFVSLYDGATRFADKTSVFSVRGVRGGL